MSNKKTVLVFLAAMIVVGALGVGSLGAAGSASPDSKDGDDEGRDDLTVLTKTRNEKVVDLGAPGPSQGDMRIVNAPLYNESGKEKVGRTEVVCVTTDPANKPDEKANVAECTVTYTLPGGEISQQGVQPFPELPKTPDRNVEAITGGTEEYAGVEGTVLIEPRGNKVTHTFCFLG